MENEKRKRTRDQGDNEDHKQSLKNKKPAIYNEKDNELFDDIGIFDFPWLKEGVVFKGVDEYVDPDDTFARCSCLDEVYDTFDYLQSLVVSPAIDENINDKKFEDESFRSFKIDDLEPVDCIWSSIINKPLDIGLNKA